MADYSDEPKDDNGSTEDEYPETNDHCPDPTEAYERLQQWVARDNEIATRRQAALDDVAARVEQTKGKQKAYEDARKAHLHKLKELHGRLTGLQTTIECELSEDYRNELIDCFCEKAVTADESVRPDPPNIDCEEAEQTQSTTNLEMLQTEAAAIQALIEWLQAELDEKVSLPEQLEALVTALASEIAALESSIADGTIEFNRAFVILLSLRRRFVALRCKLTDSRTYVCEIYGLLDELIEAYDLLVCVWGAIARLKKKAEIEAEKKAKAAASLIDDVLICAKPDPGASEPDDACIDVTEIDPCGEGCKDDSSEEEEEYDEPTDAPQQSS